MKRRRGRMVKFGRDEGWDGEKESDGKGGGGIEGLKKEESWWSVCLWGGIIELFHPHCHWQVWHLALEHTLFYLCVCVCVQVLSPLYSISIKHTQKHLLQPFILITNGQEAKMCVFLCHTHSCLPCLQGPDLTRKTTSIDSRRTFKSVVSFKPFKASNILLARSCSEQYVVGSQWEVLHRS